MNFYYIYNCIINIYYAYFFLLYNLKKIISCNFLLFYTYMREWENLFNNFK